ncbi:MAG: M48 family metalloprotease, partial [Vicinamibacteria bacterium]
RGTLGLLDDEAELAEVIGHENGHVGHRHIAKQIDRSVGIGALMALANGVYLYARGDKVTESQQEAVDAANAAIPALILNGFGRDQELEADQHGLKTMVASGYDPRGAIRVFEKFQKLSPEVKGLEVYFQSHPTAKTRISELTASINRRYPGVGGENFRDRYQSIVKGGSTLSAQTGEMIPGVPDEVLYIGGGAIAVTVVLAALGVL